MTKIILAAILVLACNSALAQEPLEGKIEFQKKDQPAAVMELPYPPNVVEDAIKGYLAKRGVKGNSSKGVHIFKGTKLSDLDLTNSDLYFKVDRKSRKEKDASVVYLFVTKENESPATRIDGDTYGLEGAKSFLKEMLPSIEAHNLEVDISGQEAALKKAERKYDNLADEAKDLEKRMKKLEENIEENKKNIERQRQEIENQRKILETMRLKRKS